ncbi:MAG: hypothetical protein FWG30_11070 [Eubacteriaceae bacterium]|nr:hypothetical protein [Eubacteriaceae bacterium]
MYKYAKRLHLAAAFLLLLQMAPVSASEVHIHSKGRDFRYDYSFGRQNAGIDTGRYQYCEECALSFAPARKGSASRLSAGDIDYEPPSDQEDDAASAISTASTEDFEEGIISELHKEIENIALQSAFLLDITKPSNTASIEVGVPEVYSLLVGTGKPSAFMFALEAKGDCPMPLGSEALSHIVIANGTNAVSFGEIEFTAPGTYIYAVRGIQGSNNSIAYDTKEYEYVVEVALSDGNLYKKSEEIYLNGMRQPFKGGFQYSSFCGSKAVESIYIEAAIDTTNKKAAGDYIQPPAVEATGSPNTGDPSITGFYLTIAFSSLQLAAIIGIKPTIKDWLHKASRSQ